MTNFTYFYVTAFIFILVTGTLHAVPLDTTDAPPLPQSEENSTNQANILAEESNNSNSTSISAAQQLTEPETAASEQNAQTAETANPASGNYEPPNAATSMYASFLTPEAIQQYVNQIGAAYPGYAAYPAPIGYAPAAPPSPLPPPPPAGAAPIYPGPYVVQTGYEGYLVPANTDLTSKPDNSNNSGLLRPLTYLANLFSAMMMSAFFRVVAGIFVAISMIFFGGAVSRLICNVTPLCAITNIAVEYLKSDKGNNADRVGRMIAEGMTPERVRRATEIVQNAIRKYQQLQQLVGNEGNED